MATLYEGYNFEGRSVDVYASEENLSGLRFNDKARSARFQGEWRVCEDAGFGGRCQTVRGDVPDLNRIGMAERISSLQTSSGGYGGGYGGGGRPGWSGGQGRSAEGARSVFFPYPSFDGRDIAAGGMSANAFCRSQGLGPALYYDSNDRAPSAVDGEGRYVANTTIIRDLLCRRY
ncbi:MAG: beta/gamma crystallin-related protein [Phenylobacterium sp.]|uniref:beta/gamma crystallin-related protein n=1 Tax=Phenylobacterium sp. TaxID=1871053 RepID=UPI00391C5DB2